MIKYGHQRKRQLIERALDIYLSKMRVTKVWMLSHHKKACVLMKQYVKLKIAVVILTVIQAHQMMVT